MVLDELKRVSNERDASSKDLWRQKEHEGRWDEVAKLREQKHEVVDQSKSSENVNGSPLEPQGNVTEKIVESPLVRPNLLRQHQISLLRPQHQVYLHFLRSRSLENLKSMRKRVKSFLI
jgi:hypothetical protein